MYWSPKFKDEEKSVPWEWDRLYSKLMLYIISSAFVSSFDCNDKVNKHLPVKSKSLLNGQLLLFWSGPYKQSRWTEIFVWAHGISEICWIAENWGLLEC